MTNDTSTLNGALRELGETMAANLTTQGVPSTYDEGLTTLAGKILDIQGGGGGTRTLTLTADKSILSYYDSDTATLSATLLEDGEPVPNVSVEFWSGSVSLGTAVTNSSGVAEKVYSSSGSGDVSLSASVGTLVSKTYDIKDAIKYYSGTLTTTTVISVPNLPTDFEMSWKTIRQSGKTAYLKFGLSEAHVIYGGILSAYDNVDNIGIYRYVQGQGNKQGQMISGYSLPANVEKTITMRHENNIASISIDGQSTSFTNTALTSRDYVRADINGGSIKEILIMPL